MNQSALRWNRLIVVCCFAVPSSAPADDWPQWRGPLRDGVWRENGVQERFPPGGLSVRWRTAIGSGFSGPAVAAGRVFVMDRSLDKSAPTDVKTEWNHRDKTKGLERVLCLDEATGRVLWEHKYACAYEAAYGSGPRATPTVVGDRVYTLGAMGDLFCFDSNTGRIVWQKSLVRDWHAEVPLYGFASAPLVDGDRLIVMVGGQGQAVVALNRHTGGEVWKAGSASEPGYCAPLIHAFAGRRQLVVWHGDGLAGLEPESGKPLWFVSHPVTAGIAISTPAIADNRLAVSSQYEGVLMLEFKAGAVEPTVVWKASAGTLPERQWKKAGFNTTMSTVLLRDGCVYGVSLYGETCCLNADTGERIWTTLQPTSGGKEPRERWSTLFMVPHGDKVFLWNDHGDLILSRLTRAGYQEISRSRLLEPDMLSAGSGGRKVAWSHPAFANRCVCARNDHEIVCVSLAATPGSADAPRKALAFDVKLDVVRQELHPDFCWFLPRIVAVPGAGREGRPSVVMTLQKHLAASDHYSGLWMMRSDDLGETWTGPTEIPQLGWTTGADGVVTAVADVTPGWHAPSGKVIAMGCTVRYGKSGEQLSDIPRFSQTAYAVFDPKTGQWSKWQVLDLPADEKFNMARNACAQWVVRPDGTLLVPIYFGKAADVPASVTVLHCRFDGRTLCYLRHGDELSLNVVRGLCEPSIVAFRDRFYLTIRNDIKGYAAVSDDGLRYRPIKPWTFDDGSELGSYNTQQHWLAHQNGLFLAYTRRGANNDHIPRNRAPLFLAQVDPERLCVMRASERAIIPERGAMLGNFGAAAVNDRESWVTDAEYIAKGQASPRGANGSVFAARVLWSDPNQLAPGK